jgi:hypothetical protein
VLGQLLEFSLTASPIAPTLEFFRALGFEELPGGDLLATPHVAVWDGTATIGLHDHELDEPALTFVRPRLGDHLRGLRHAGIELEYQRLGDDEFNEAGFRDPNDQLVVMLEARTFSPGVWHPGRVAACGKLVEYGLATDSIEDSRAFWEKLGFACVAEGVEPHAWARLAGHGLTLGLHRTTAFKTALCYASHPLQGRVEYLKAKGLDVRLGTPLKSARRDSACLRGADHMPIFMLDDVAA